MKTRDKITIRRLELIPDPIAWENYPYLFEARPILQYTRNTMVIVVASLFGAWVPCTLAGYAFARIPFPGRNIFFGILLATMMLPYVVRLIPLFLFFDEIGWTRTFGPADLAASCSGTMPSIFSCTGNFSAAYRKISMTRPALTAVPNSASGGGFSCRCRVRCLAAVSIFAFSFAWNDFLNPLIYLGSNKELWTLALGLNALQGFEGEDNSLNLIMVFSMLMIIPMLIVFYFGQKHLISGVTAQGSLKG